MLSTVELICLSAGVSSVWMFGTATYVTSLAFRHHTPNSARDGYATEWALFISAQLSTDVVSAL